MATITSNGTGGGNWTAGATWAGGTKPADGDAVVIAASDVIVYDEDMSGWANGIAGLTLGASGVLDACTSPSGNYYLKMAGHITATAAGAELRAGTAGTPYPVDCTFEIYFNGNYQIRGHSSSYLTCKFYCYEPVPRFVKLLSASPKAITGISKGDPCTITCPSHGYVAGNVIWLVNVGGMHELDLQRVVVRSALDADNFTIRWIWQNLEVDSTDFTTYTSGGYACPDTAKAVGSTVFEVDGDVTGDPEWTRSGARIKILSLNSGYSSENFYIQSTTSSSITTTVSSGAIKYSGALVVLVTRNVKITSYSTASTTNGLIYQGTGHVLGCSVMPGHNGTNCITGARDIVMPKSGCYLQGNGAYYLSAVVGASISGMLSGYYGCYSSQNVTVESDGIAAGTYYCFHVGCHNSKMLGTAYGNQQVWSGSSTYGVYFNGTAIGCNYICNTALTSAYLTGIAKDCAAIMGLSPGGVVHNLKAYNVAYILVNAEGCIVHNVEQHGGNYFIQSSYGALVSNCLSKDIYADIYASNVRMSNMIFGGLYEFNNMSYLGITDCSESYDHKGVAGAFRSWTLGGITSSNTSEKPTGRTRSYQSVCESATYPCWHQREILVEAGRQVRIRIWGKADAGVTYKAQLVLPTDDPLVTGSGTGEWEQTMTADGSWYEYKTAWTNTATYPVTIYLRFLATAASGNAYCDFQWAFDRSPSRR